MYINGDELYFEDKEALEKGLQYLLSTATVGEKLFALMNLEVPTTIEDQENNEETKET